MAAVYQSLFGGDVYPSLEEKVANLLFNEIDRSVFAEENKIENLIRLTDYHEKDIADIFNIADEVALDNYKNILKGKSVVLFFLIPVFEHGLLSRRVYICWVDNQFYFLQKRLIKRRFKRCLWLFE